MMHSKNKILIICEGDKTEPFILNHIKELYNRSGNGSKFNMNFITYKTNIYNFYNELMLLENEFGIDGTVDTIEFLHIMIKKRGSEEDKKILNEKFESIYFIFDLDIHDTHNTLEQKINKIKELTKYFNEDTERGLLIINFPMVEAIKHFNEPKLSNYNYNIKVSDLSNYKKFIHEFNDLNIKNLLKEDVESLIALNLIRANNALHNKINYIKFNGNELFEFYYNQLENYDNLSPVASLLFILPIYFGEEFYKTLPKID